MILINCAFNEGPDVIFNVFYFASLQCWIGSKSKYDWLNCSLDQ